MNRSIKLGLILFLMVVLAFPVSGINFTQAQAATSVDHFKSSSPTPLGEPGSDLRTPQDFEAASSSHPNQADQVFVSRCRFDPMNSMLYGPITGNVYNAIVGDTTYSYDDGTQCYYPQTESIIVANPTNSNNVLVAANEPRMDGHAVYSSMDGGKTWINVMLPGWTKTTNGQGVFSRLDTCGDPNLAFGPDGTAYYSGLVCSTSKIAFYSGLAVASTHDGGRTWSAPRMVAFTNSNNNFNDKDWITVGADGAVYVTWSRFKFIPSQGYVASPIVISESHDGGQSWSDWVAVSDSSHPYDQGSFPLVAPDGTLYVAYEGSTPSSGYQADAVVLAHSIDGGRTFTNTELARVYDDYNCYPINVAQGEPTLSGEQFRINSFPSFAIDPTNGTFAITWADDQMNPGCGYEKGGTFAGSTSNQVKLITSTDGIHWTAPKVITTGASDKVFPAVGANAGRIFISYYTRAYSTDTPNCEAIMQDTQTLALTLIPGSVCLDVASKSSNDNFVAESRLTNESSNPFIEQSGAFIGDYNGATITASGEALTVWTDFRGNPGVTTPNMDIYAAIGR